MPLPGAVDVAAPKPEGQEHPIRVVRVHHDRVLLGRGCGRRLRCDDEPARRRGATSLHGARITAASLGAARTLLSRMDSPTVATESAPAAASAAVLPTPARAVRRPRAADQPLDAASMIQDVVSRLQEQGNVEADRLRESIRKAIAVLQAAVGGAL